MRTHTRACERFEHLEKSSGVRRVRTKKKEKKKKGRACERFEGLELGECSGVRRVSVDPLQLHTSAYASIRQHTPAYVSMRLELGESSGVRRVSMHPLLLARSKHRL
jgi:hypothetical protein